MGVILKSFDETELIGYTYNGGKLRVIAYQGRDTSKKNRIYQVECEVCSRDIELFPEKYFLISKSNIIAGNIPCGCSKNHKWSEAQTLIRLRRKTEGKLFIYGIVGDFKGHTTKIKWRCLIHPGDRVTSVNDLNDNKMCSVCQGRYPVGTHRKLEEEEAYKRCVEACKEKGYIPLRFKQEYTGTGTARFLYECKEHGIQESSYDNMIREGRCRSCHIAKRTSLGTFGYYGWYPDRADEDDFLYILCFNHDSYIKIGRTFNIKQRFYNLKRESGDKDIATLMLLKGSHEAVYRTEQYLHKTLRKLGLHYDSGWSKETFKMESLPIILEKLNNVKGMTRIEVNNKEEVCI